MSDAEVAAKQINGVELSSAEAVSESEDRRRIEETIHKPGAISVDARGAFVVHDGSATPVRDEDAGVLHHIEDIRLPHHTAIVSHVAIDVREYNRLTGFVHH